MSEAQYLEHERLDVYRAALELDAVISRAIPRRGHRFLRDQIDRASIGIVLCIARRFYEMARGSALETAAVLDILRARGMLPATSYEQARMLLLRIVQMLTRLSGPPRNP